MTADYRSFIQFHHPGTEHDLRSGSGWNTAENGHRRKFMRLDGRWLDDHDETQSGAMWAWGEWEAQSKPLRDLDQSHDARLPSRLWRPYYEPMSDYGRLQNTDPFVFGCRFLYSNCKQNGALRRLSPGSVIAFGSRFRGEWVLDTVFVVACSIEYRTHDMRADLAERVPSAFLEVTGRPITTNNRTETLRLYYGATPGKPVGGMFSFVPATPAGGNRGFGRPPISLPSEHFDKTQRRGEYGRRTDLAPGTRLGLWESLVRQVRMAGLVLGTYAKLPERGYP